MLELRNCTVSTHENEVSTMKKWAPLLLLPALAACSVVASTKDSLVVSNTLQSPPNASSESPATNGAAPAPAAPEPPKPKLAETFGFTYPDAVRGIYVTGHSAGGDRLDSLIDLTDKTDLNAMVIDIKDDYGNITYTINDPKWEALSKPYIKDPKALIAKLKQHNIYPIARVVVFKDSMFAEQHPELSFVENGHVWKNGRGEAFVNPFLPQVWDHSVDIAKRAAELGFQEIQFDYVRFPEGFENMDSSLQYSMGEYKDRKPSKFTKLEQEYQTATAAFESKQAELKKNQEAAQTKVNELKANSSPTEEQKKELQTAEETLNKAVADLQNHQKAMPKAPDYSDKERKVQLRVDAVTDFVAHAKKELEPLGVKVSVDIFGYSATLPEAPGIGQNFSRICENVDVISSMIYPSHWGAGYFNIAKPDLEPYRLVAEYSKSENQVFAQLSKKPVSRPWIQDFSAPWLGAGNWKSYGKADVEAQIKALQDHGIKEFLLWNAGNSYTDGVDYTP